MFDKLYIAIRFLAIMRKILGDFIFFRKVVHFIVGFLDLNMDTFSLEIVPIMEFLENAKNVKFYRNL